MTAAALATSESVLRVPLARLHPSPTNPRKHLGDLTELAASIAQVGVLEPVVARPKGDDFEIAFGHRRVAAAERAGVEDVPVIVRDYSDDEVLEAQIVENNNRSDVHPLDEADGFRALMERNYPPQRIADRIGRPLGYVLQRLKLCDLSKESRKALDEEEISIGVAMLLAKLPSQKLQDEALKEVTQYRVGDGQMSVAEARKTLEANVMCALKGAPFRVDDAALVPAAGPCTTCPKRTGVQVDLFADASSPDLCTDPKCFRSKTDAIWQIRAKEHKAAGGDVLSAKDADLMLGGGKYSSAGHTMRGQYKALDDSEYIGNKRKTVRALFGKELPPVTLARDPASGAIVELVASKDAQTALRKLTGQSESKPGVKLTTSTAEKQRKEKEAISAEACKRLVANIAAKIESRTVWKSVEIELLRGIAICLVTSTWSELHKRAAKRRGWLDAPPTAEQENGKTKKASKRLARPLMPGEVLHNKIETASHGELASLLVEVLIGRELPSGYSDALGDGAIQICNALDVSYEEELARVQKEFATKREAKASKTPVKKKGAHLAAKSSPGDGKRKPKRKAKLLLTARQAKAKSRKARK